MELITWTLLFLLAAFAWFLLRHKTESRVNIPPGPAGLPVIGSPWLFSQSFHVLFNEMAKCWGPVFSVKIFWNRLVVFNTPDAVREAFARQSDWEKLNGRPPALIANEHLENSTTFLQPMERWSKQRRLVHKILNFYGEGLEGTESTIQEELRHVSECLETKGESVDLNDVIYPSLINIITILLIGRRFEYGSPLLKNVIDFDEAAANGGDIRNSLFLTVFPFMKYIPFGPGKNVIKVQRTTKQFMQDYFYESKTTYKPDVTRGMIDFLFHHQRESQLPDGTVWLEDKYIKSIVLEMVGAGSITTRSALYSFFLVIANKPEVANKIRHELDDIVGPGRFPKLEDRSKMPYTMAAILELLRYISHAPLGIPHIALDDVMSNGYHIPRNTMMMANLWLIHHDPNIWHEPWEFKPERFLDEERHLLPADHIRRKNLMPFGIGRRSCVGETFAKSRMFLFITTLLQRFDFLPDPSNPLPECDPRRFKGGVVLSPEQYYVSVTPRS